MEIRDVAGEGVTELAELAAKFQTTLLALQGIGRIVEAAEGLDELRECFAKAWPIYAAFDQGSVAGYMVCRWEGPRLWLEALYVDSPVRRRGTGTSLFRRAEELARTGGGTVCLRVQPENHLMLSFLRSCGYDVLDHLEVRRALPGEQLNHSIRVGGQKFKAARPLSPGRLLGESDPGGKKKKRRKRKNHPPPGIFGDGWEEEFGQNGDFYFIAGFTSGGAPYGVTWEEAFADGLLSEEEVRERELQSPEEQGSGSWGDEDIPF